MSIAQPRRLGHLVLKVRDLNASVKFYTEIVGLKVSDYIADRMAFLRAGTDHHDLALAQLPEEALNARLPDDAPGLEHFSYFIETYEEIERIAVMLKERGVPIVRGPGKHGPGENVFLVFKDPDGNNVEFYSEMVIIDEQHPYEPKVWNDELESLDVWRCKRWAVEPSPALKKKYGI